MSSANFVINYHIAANDVDTNWLNLCNLLMQPKREDEEVHKLIALHREKLKLVKEHENAIVINEPHWYTSKKIDYIILGVDLVLAAATLGVGIWDYVYQQNLPGNVKRTKALLACLIVTTVFAFLYSGIKGIRIYLKHEVKKNIADQLAKRKQAMWEQEKAFDLFCEYLQEKDPKVQTVKMQGIVHHLKRIPHEFGNAYKALDDFLSELIRVAQANEEAKELVNELVQIQQKRRSRELPLPAPKDDKLKKRISGVPISGSQFLRLEGADKASPAPQAKESFRMLKRVDEFSEREKVIFARLKTVTGHHFKKIRAEGEEIINPLEEEIPSEPVLLTPAHAVIDVRDLDDKNTKSIEDPD